MKNWYEEWELLYPELDISQANKDSIQNVMCHIIQETKEEVLKELLCHHEQTRWAKDDIETESWKWYNAGYDDAIQDLKEEVYNKFGIKL